jgi:cytoskeletal protein RodZ
MSNESLKKFAEELKEVRKKNNLTLEQIFTKTRIDKKYLKSIEEGDFSVLPEVYIRAFIKEYAKSIKLDPAEVIAKYEMAQKGMSQEDSKTLETNDQKSESKDVVENEISNTYEKTTQIEYKENNVKGNKTFYYALSGIIMLLFIFAIYKIFLSGNNTDIVMEKPFEEIIENGENNKQEMLIDSDDPEVNTKNIEQGKVEENNLEIDQSIPENSNETISPELLTLKILANDKSWIRVITDDNDNIEFTIEQGVSKVVTAKDKFYLHIGNSGGIKLQLNNKELNFSGTQGKVRKIFITKDGIEYLRRTPTLNAEEG